MHAASILLTVLAVSVLGETPTARKLPSNKPIVSFKLRDHRSAWHSLEDCKGKKLVVVAFLGAAVRSLPVDRVRRIRGDELSSRVDHPGRGGGCSPEGEVREER